MLTSQHFEIQTTNRSDLLRFVSAFCYSPSFTHKQRHFTMASARPPRRMTAAAALAQLQNQDDDSGDDSLDETSSDEEVENIHDDQQNSESSEEEDELSVREDGDRAQDDYSGLLPLPGRDGTVWHPYEENRNRGQSRRQNIIKVTPGPTSHAKQTIERPIDAFKLIMDTVMLTWIVRFTNFEALR